MVKVRPTVVIGDIQGCAATLGVLLERCRDRLGLFEACFVGDLINRGTGSLSVLEHVKSCGFETVLGNHEVYLLAVVAGAMERKEDTLDELFDAPSLMGWVDWLRHRPVLIELGGHTIVHAGIDPRWTRTVMLAYAKRLEEGLRSEHWKSFLKSIVGDEIQDQELAVALQTFTRMRMLTSDGRLDARFKGLPEDAPAHLQPWYRVYQGQLGPILFGHWAALGARRLGHCTSLDSGCVWGRELTAYILPGGEFISCPVVDADLPRRV
jgi:bis(5'-nucleosyl)-tetraphosphatase (symmetrical)